MTGARAPLAPRRHNTGGIIGTGKLQQRRAEEQDGGGLDGDWWRRGLGIRSPSQDWQRHRGELGQGKLARSTRVHWYKSLPSQLAVGQQVVPLAMLD